MLLFFQVISPWDLWWTVVYNHSQGLWFPCNGSMGWYIYIIYFTYFPLYSFIPYNNNNTCFAFFQGTSDPYVVLELDTQIVKTNVKWGYVSIYTKLNLSIYIWFLSVIIRTKEPTWNEELTLYIKLPPTNNLNIAAWDANLVAPHKRMGNSSLTLESLCDGKFFYFSLNFSTLVAHSIININTLRLMYNRKFTRGPSWIGRNGRWRKSAAGGTFS